MTTKSEPKPRRTTMVPVTTMEELPVRTPEERRALVASLEEGEARIGAGQFVEYEPEPLRDRLLGIHRKATLPQTA